MNSNSYAASCKLLCLSLYRHLLTSRHTNIYYNLLCRVPKYQIRLIRTNNDYDYLVFYIYIPILVSECPAMLLSTYYGIKTRKKVITHSRVGHNSICESNFAKCHNLFKNYALVCVGKY